MLGNEMAEDVEMLITASSKSTGPYWGVEVEGIYCPIEEYRRDFLAYFNKSYDEIAREELLEKEKARNELIQKLPVLDFNLKLKDFNLKGVIEVSSSLIDSVNNKLISLIEGHGKSEGQ